MFVEEGFRMRFANGEVIDFYADSAAQKDAWMNVLSECVGKDAAGSKGWTTMVLEKERKEKSQVKALRENPNSNSAPQFRPRSHEGTGSKSMPSSPVKPAHTRTQSHAPPPPDARHKPTTGPRQRESAGKANNRRDQVRSMIF
jgi:hypothetical protein